MIYNNYRKIIMTTPEEVTTEVVADDASPDLPATFGDSVDALVKTIERDDKGKLVFNEDTSEELKYAVRSKIRQSDTYSEFQKGHQDNIKLTARNKELHKKLEENTKVNFTKEQTDNMESVKFDDPDKYRVLYNAYEKENLAAQSVEMETLLGDVEKKAFIENEIDNKIKILEAFCERENVNLTPEIMDNDVPKRFLNDYESGKYSFEALLYKSVDWLNSQKVVTSGAEVPGIANLSKVGGSENPSVDSQRRAQEVAFRDMMF